MIMAAIPGWAYLLSGIAISVFSKIVEKNSKPGQFALFFWVGIIFIVVGVGKLVYKYVFRKEKKDSSVIHHPIHRQAAMHQRQSSHNLGASHNLSQHQQPLQQTQQMHHFQGQHQVSKASQQQVQMQESSIIVPCPACGTRHYNYANFCMRCGAKIKKI
jgi:hypothetical protein